MTNSNATLANNTSRPRAKLQEDAHAIESLIAAAMAMQDSEKPEEITVILELAYAQAVRLNENLDSTSFSKGAGQ